MSADEYRRYDQVEVGDVVKGVGREGVVTGVEACGHSGVTLRLGPGRAMCASRTTPILVMGSDD